MFPRGYVIPPLFRLALEDKINVFPSYGGAVSRDITEEFYSHALERVTHEGNVVFAFSGGASTLTGCGKSWGAAGYFEKKVAPWAGYDFTYKDVFFSRQEVIDRLREFKDGQCLILDEQTKEFGVGSLRESAELTNIIETCRKFRINFIHCCPRVAMGAHHGICEFWSVINPGLAQSIALYGLETDAMGGLNALGYVVFPAPTPEFQKGYEKRKDAFIRSMLAEQGSARFESSEKTAAEMAKDPVFGKLKSVSMRKLYILKKYPQLRNHTGEEIAQIANLADLEGKLKGAGGDE